MLSTAWSPLEGRAQCAQDVLTAQSPEASIFVTLFFLNTTREEGSQETRIWVPVSSLLWPLVRSLFRPQFLHVLNVEG